MSKHRSTTAVGAREGMPGVAVSEVQPDMESSRSLLVAVSRVAAAGLAALVVFLTSAVLSPEARGEFAALQSGAMLLSSVAGGSLGLGIAVVVGRRAGSARRMAALSWLVALGLVAVLGAAAVVLAGPLGVRTAGTLAVAGAAAALAAYGGLQGIPIGLGAMARYAGSDLVRSAVSLLAPAVALAAGERDPAILVALWAVGPLLASFGLLARLPNDEAAARQSAAAPRTSRGIETRLAVARSLKAHPANVVGLAVTRLDMVLLAAVSSSRDVAFYSLAVVIAEAAWLLPSALAITATSNFVRFRREQAADAAHGAVGGTVLAAAASGLAAGALGVGCIFLFLPAAYHHSIAPLVVLLAGTIPYSVGHVVSPFLVTAVDRAGTATTIATVTLVADLVLVLVLGGPLGALGAAIASSAAYCVNAALNVAALRTHAPA